MTDWPIFGDIIILLKPIRHRMRQPFNLSLGKGSYLRVMQPHFGAFLKAKDKDGNIWLLFSNEFRKASPLEILAMQAI